MKSRQAAPSFLVPQFLGRAEADMTAHGHGEQLDAFRETLTRRRRLQIYAMMGLTDPKQMDKLQRAKAADMADAMGYDRVIRRRKDGKDHLVFNESVYSQIEDTGLALRRKPIEVFTREPVGVMKNGRRKWRTGIVELAILQEFGFYYEDEDGNPISLDSLKKDEKDKLIKYEQPEGPPLYAIPATDEKGNVIKNDDGTIRRRPANGLQYRWSSRFAELSQDRGTSWIIYLEAVKILRRYLKKPVSFDLMDKTLFWRGEGQAEISHDKLIEHLNIRSRDTKRVQATIDEAFADMLKEGIIDKPVTVREAGYYKPTPKTNRPRRKDKVYQWHRAAKWQPGRKLIAVAEDRLEAVNEGKTEIMKS